jgi:NADPH:quinone reductase-like Zn-dependent oxidoreductase
MKRTMKAAVVREFGKPLAIEDVPIPEVGPGQVLVKINKLNGETLKTAFRADSLGVR